MRAGSIPYKTYEYLGAQRPILAAVPDGDVRDMLAPLPGVTLVRPGDVDAMAEALRPTHRRRARVADAATRPALERRQCVAAIAEVAGPGARGSPRVALQCPVDRDCTT